MKTVYIYTLEHPITEEIRYVGKTKNPKMRFHNHCNKLHNEKSHKRNWINKLKKEGLKPKMKILDEVLESEWKFWERFWINQLKQWNFNLVNHTSGGDGSTLGNETSFKKGNIAFNDTNTYIMCENCKKEFKINPSRLGKKKFCSKECYSESKKGISFINNGSFKNNHTPWNKGITGYSTSKKGKPLQKEIKEKISNTLKGKLSKKKRKVKQLDMNRNLIKEFSSITEAKLKTGIKGINNVLTGRAKKAGGYLWE